MRMVILLFVLCICAFRVFAQTDSLTIEADTSTSTSMPWMPFSDSLYRISPENPFEVCPKIEDIEGLPIFKSMGDSLYLKRGDLIIFKDTTYCVFKDTLAFLPYGVPYRLGKSTEIRANDLYESLKRKTDKYWWSSLAYSSVINYDPSWRKMQTEKVIEFKEAQIIYKPYQGKFIRSISIRQVDILEGSVTDTTRSAHSLLAKLANKLHTNTREKIIRNNLLFEPGDTIFDYLVADNERLIRQLPYIQDCRIYVFNNPDDSTLVDVWVVTEDRFSTAVDGTIGGLGDYYGELSERNLFGIGHEVGLGIRYVETNNPSNDYTPWYRARNIGGSFVDVSLRYRNSFRGTELIGSIGRGFVNQFTKYAFNAEVGSITINAQQMQMDSTFKPALYTYNYEDVWLGRQFMVGDKEGRQNLLFVTRYRRYDAVNRPFVNADSNKVFHNYRLLLGGITFRKLNYYKNNYVYRLGITEDIPYGYFVQYNLGYEDHEFKPRAYTSALLGFGFKLTGLGYASLVNEFGSYVRNETFEQGQYKFKFNLIANMMKLGRYRLRNIITYNYVVGLNRIQGESVSIERQIRGLKGTGLDGREVSLFHYELVNFTPWNVYGFRLAIATYADIAILHADKNSAAAFNVYSSCGLSFRIRNESLAIRSIEISLGYFPNTTDIIGNWVTQFSTSTPASQSLNINVVPSIGSYDFR